MDNGEQTTSDIKISHLSSHISPFTIAHSHDATRYTLTARSNGLYLAYENHAPADDRLHRCMHNGSADG